MCILRKWTYVLFCLELTLRKLFFLGTSLANCFVDRESSTLQKDISLCFNDIFKFGGCVCILRTWTDVLFRWN